MDEFERIVTLEYERDELYRGILDAGNEVLAAKSVIERCGESCGSYKIAFEHLARVIGITIRMANVELRTGDYPKEMIDRGSKLAKTIEDGFPYGA